MSISLKLDWPPTVNTYWRSTLRGRYGGISVLLSAKGRKYKEQAALAILEQNVPRGTPEARYEVLIDAYPPDRRKRDLDNILKPILDVLEDSGVLPNDEQVDILMIRRRERGGYVRIHLTEIEPQYSLTG